MKKGLYKPAFLPDPTGHGGERRSFQVKALLADRFQLINYIEFKNSFDPFYIRYLKGLLFLFKHKLKLRSLYNISMAGFFVNRFNYIIRMNREVEYFFWEPAHDYSDYFVPYLCAGERIRLVAFPHNLESLSFGRRTVLSGETAPGWFVEEIKILRKCDYVVTISLEEQWLLQLYAIKAGFLPYIPSKQEHSRLLRVRMRRNQYRGGDYLLALGTFSNPPTRQGMLDIVDFCIQTGCPAKIIIAGFDTGEILRLCENLPENITVLGAVTPERLEELLVGCRAVLVYQKCGTGALTRLIELCIAGVPVLANTTSLRSHQNIRGFVPFDDLNVLNIASGIVFEMPDPENLKIDEFRNMIVEQLIECSTKQL